MGYWNHPPVHFEVGHRYKMQMLFKGETIFATAKRLRFVNQPTKRGDKWESRGVGHENEVRFVWAESGSVSVFVEVKLLVGIGFCRSLKVGKLYLTYEKVSRPRPCNFNGDVFVGFDMVWIWLGDFLCDSERTMTAERQAKPVTDVRRPNFGGWGEGMKCRDENLQVVWCCFGKEWENGYSIETQVDDLPEWWMSIELCSLC